MVKAPSVTVTAVPMIETSVPVGAAGVGVAMALVVILAGAAARFVCVNVKGPLKPPSVVFCTRSKAAPLVNVQVMSEPALTLIAGMVSTLLASVPKLAGLPVAPALASTHVAEMMPKPVTAGSVKVTAVLIAVTGIGEGVAGVAVPVATVVMLAGVAVRFDWVKLKVPILLTVIFCNFTVARSLVSVQTIEASATMAAAESVMVLPLRVAVPAPRPVQVKLPSTKPTAGVSVMAVAVLRAVKYWAVLVVVPPGTVVVMAVFG